MLIPSPLAGDVRERASLSRRVNANSQRVTLEGNGITKLIKKGEC